MSAAASATSSDEREIAELAATLAKWYEDRSLIRRLCAIESPIALTILLALEPTADGEDTLPVWLANHRTWTHELRMLAGREVRLQLLIADALMQSSVNLDAVIIADLSWRDAWMTP